MIVPIIIGTIIIEIMQTIRLDDGKAQAYMHIQNMICQKCYLEALLKFPFDCQDFHCTVRVSLGLSGFPSNCHFTMPGRINSYED